MKKLCVDLKHPAFYGHVHLHRSQAHFPPYLTSQGETLVSCSCEQKLIGPGITQAIGSHSSWFELCKLWSCVFNKCIKRGCFWVVHAYFNKNSTHRSETKITDKCCEILFLIFLHYIPHEKCIHHSIKLGDMINKLIPCTTVLDTWICTMLISIKIVNIDTRYKLSNSISYLFYTIIYTILHISDDSMVPVLRTKAIKFRFYMFLKEGFYTWILFN